jgi:flagellin-like protein
MGDYPIIGILIVIAFVLILFLLLREVVLWYYKINTSLDLQIETNKHLKKLTEQNEIIINHIKKDENLNQN